MEHINLVFEHKVFCCEHYLVGKTTIVLLNPFHATGLFLYHLKKSENLWFLDVSREYRDQWYEMGYCVENIIAN